MAPTSITPPVFHILLALAEADLHGYAIIKDIEQRTDGEVRLTASTLYGALKRMLEAGLIQEVDDAEAPGEDSRRRPYAITRRGREVASAEARRLARLTRMARDKRLLPAVESPGGKDAG